MGYAGAAKASRHLGISVHAEAAEDGCVPAHSAVAMMYANGKGVPQNYAEAGNW
jgi:TPR repeat protein